MLRSGPTPNLTVMKNISNKCCPGAAFAAHGDVKSHTGNVLTLGRGADKRISKKQKLNAKSSTDADVVLAAAEEHSRK